MLQSFYTSPLHYRKALSFHTRWQLIYSFNAIKNNIKLHFFLFYWRRIYGLFMYGTQRTERQSIKLKCNRWSLPYLIREIIENCKINSLFKNKYYIDSARCSSTLVFLLLKFKNVIRKSLIFISNFCSKWHDKIKNQLVILGQKTNVFIF